MLIQWFDGFDYAHHRQLTTGDSTDYRKRNMAQNKDKTKEKGEAERLQTLYKAFLSLRNVKECAAFLRDLCTVSEIEAMSERFAVAKLISNNMSYRDISEKTGVSTTTITRVAHWLRHGMGGYTSVLARPLTSSVKNEGRMKIAIQKSGKLYDASMQYLSNRGLVFPTKEKSLILPCENSDIDILFLRDDDIPEYVASGVADFGIVGQNVLAEKALDLKTLKKLGFGKCSLQLAVPKNSQIKKLKDLDGKRIATSYPKLLADYLRENDVRASITVLSGSVEITPELNLADAICDIVQTGSTLKAHNLAPLATIMESQAVLITNSDTSAIKTEFLKLIEK